MDMSSPHLMMRTLTCAAAALIALSVLARPLAAAPEDEVRATFERFVAAHNDHDADAVDALLLDSPDFLWITRGNPVWGPDAAMERFAALYQGTWHLEPESDSLKVMMLTEDVAQLYVPIMFSIGQAGQAVEPSRFLMNQVLVKTPAGWKISGLLPIPVPAQ
jgi:ketosteroid isomerase-like protein